MCHVRVNACGRIGSGWQALRNSEGLAEALRAAIEYIHGNPVRRGLVATAEDWEWSSARWYAGLGPVKLEMDQSVLPELAPG